VISLKDAYHAVKEAEGMIRRFKKNG